MISILNGAFVFIIIEVYLIYNVMFVSGVQQSPFLYTHTHTRIYILFQILLHYRLSRDVEYSFLCFTVAPCSRLFYIQKYVSVSPELLIYPCPLSPLVTISLFPMSNRLFLI